MTTSISPQRVLIVIPAYNEQGKIGSVVSKIAPDMADRIVVVNDCSTDQTAAEAEKAGALVISHQQNQGVGAGIRTGIDYALANGFDIIAILSGDDQHDPQDLYGVLKLIQVDGYDFVQGSRRLGGLQAPNINLFRRILTWVYAKVFWLFTGFKCTDATNGGRAFLTSIFQNKSINIWQEWLNTYQLEPYLFYKVVKARYKVTEAPMKIIYHDKGTTKMKPFRDWWRIFQPMIYLSFGIRK
jgi:dolichol-phosphate mannosyltransferase